MFFMSVVFPSTVLPMGSSVDLLATTDPEAEQEEEADTPIYEKFDGLLHGAHRKAKKWVQRPVSI